MTWCRGGRGIGPTTIALIEGRWVVSWCIQAPTAADRLWHERPAASRGRAAADPLADHASELGACSQRSLRQLRSVSAHHFASVLSLWRWRLCIILKYDLLICIFWYVL